MKLWLKKTTWGSGRKGFTDSKGHEVITSVTWLPGPQKQLPGSGAILEPAEVNGVKCWGIGNPGGGLDDPVAFYRD